MSRNSGGSYTLPAGNPVVTSTTVSSSTQNSTMNDVATEITDSLSRSNKGAMLAPLSLAAGASVAAPDLTWTGDSDTGLYRVSANTVGMSSNGAKVFEWAAAAVTSAVAFIVATVKTITANASVTILGNRDAADTGSDVVSNSTNTRTAGNIHDFQNNTVSKLKVDFSGQLKWPSGPASTATTPAPGAVTVPSMSANWTAGNGLSYWKDPVNIVHIKGTATAGAAAGASPFTLPAGFRPANIRYQVTLHTGTATPISTLINTDGTFTVNSGGAITNGAVYSFDFAFLAEA